MSATIPQDGVQVTLNYNEVRKKFRENLLVRLENDTKLRPTVRRLRPQSFSVGEIRRPSRLWSPSPQQVMPEVYSGDDGGDTWWNDWQMNPSDGRRCAVPAPRLHSPAPYGSQYQQQRIASPMARVYPQMNSMYDAAGKYNDRFTRAMSEYHSNLSEVSEKEELELSDVPSNAESVCADGGVKVFEAVPIGDVGRVSTRPYNICDQAQAIEDNTSRELLLVVDKMKRKVANMACNGHRIPDKIRKLYAVLDQTELLLKRSNGDLRNVSDKERAFVERVTGRIQQGMIRGKDPRPQDLVEYLHNDDIPERDQDFDRNYNINERPEKENGNSRRYEKPEKLKKNKDEPLRIRGGISTPDMCESTFIETVSTGAGSSKMHRKQSLTKTTSHPEPEDDTMYYSADETLVGSPPPCSRSPAARSRVTFSPEHIPQRRQSVGRQVVQDDADWGPQGLASPERSPVAGPVCPLRQTPGGAAGAGYQTPRKRWGAPAAPVTPFMTSSPQGGARQRFGPPSEPGFNISPIRETRPQTPAGSGRKRWGQPTPPVVPGGWTPQAGHTPMAGWGTPQQVSALSDSSGMGTPSAERTPRKRWGPPQPPVTPGTPCAGRTPGFAGTPGTPGTPGFGRTPGTPRTPATAGTPGTPARRRWEPASPANLMSTPVGASYQRRNYGTGIETPRTSRLPRPIRGTTSTMGSELMLGIQGPGSTMETTQATIPGGMTGISRTGTCGSAPSSWFSSGSGSERSYSGQSSVGSTRSMRGSVYGSGYGAHCRSGNAPQTPGQGPMRGQSMGRPQSPGTPMSPLPIRGNISGQGTPPYIRSTYGATTPARLPGMSPIVQSPMSPSLIGLPGSLAGSVGSPGRMSAGSPRLGSPSPCGSPPGLDRSAYAGSSPGTPPGGMDRSAYAGSSGSGGSPGACPFGNLDASYNMGRMAQSPGSTPGSGMNRSASAGTPASMGSPGACPFGNLDAPYNMGRPGLFPGSSPGGMDRSASGGSALSSPGMAGACPFGNLDAPMNMRRLPQQSPAGLSASSGACPLGSLDAPLEHRRFPQRTPESPATPDPWSCPFGGSQSPFFMVNELTPPGGAPRGPVQQPPQERFMPESPTSVYQRGPRTVSPRTPYGVDRGATCGTPAIPTPRTRPGGYDRFAYAGSPMGMNYSSVTPGGGMDRVAYAGSPSDAGSSPYPGGDSPGGGGACPFGNLDAPMHYGMGSPQGSHSMDRSAYAGSPASTPGSGGSYCPFGNLDAPMQNRLGAHHSPGTGSGGYAGSGGGFGSHTPDHDTSWAASSSGACSMGSGADAFHVNEGLLQGSDRSGQSVHGTWGSAHARSNMPFPHVGIDSPHLHSEGGGAAGMDHVDFSDSSGADDIPTRLIMETEACIRDVAQVVQEAANRNEAQRLAEEMANSATSQGAEGSVVVKGIEDAPISITCNTRSAIQEFACSLRQVLEGSVQGADVHESVEEVLRTNEEAQCLLNNSRQEIEGGGGTATSAPPEYPRPDCTCAEDAAGGSPEAENQAREQIVETQEYFEDIFQMIQCLPQDPAICQVSGMVRNYLDCAGNMACQMNNNIDPGDVRPILEMETQAMEGLACLAQNLDATGGGFIDDDYADMQAMETSCQTDQPASERVEFTGDTLERVGQMNDMLSGILERINNMENELECMQGNSDVSAEAINVSELILQVLEESSLSLDEESLGNLCNRLPEIENSIQQAVCGAEAENTCGHSEYQPNASGYTASSSSSKQVAGPSGTTTKKTSKSISVSGSAGNPKYACLVENYNALQELANALGENQSHSNRLLHNLVNEIAEFLMESAQPDMDDSLLDNFNQAADQILDNVHTFLDTSTGSSASSGCCCRR